MEEVEKEKEFNEFSIRVPQRLFEKICRDAEASKRSRNSQVNVILEDYYENLDGSSRSSARAAEGV